MRRAHRRPVAQGRCGWYRVSPSQFARRARECAPKGYAPARLLATAMGLIGILLALGVLVWLSFRGWSVLILAPAAGLLAALTAGEPLLAHWTQTFMQAAAGFI